MADPHLPSSDEVDAARSPAGGWSKAQLAAWGVPWPPPKGWRAELVRRWQDAQPNIAPPVPAPPAVPLRGRGDEARVVAAFCDWLRAEGWEHVETEVAHCDVVARRGPTTLYAEAKGWTSSPGGDVDELYGQLLRRMLEGDDPHTRFAVVVPTAVEWHALRVPARVRELLRVDVFVVDDAGGVRLVPGR